MGEGARFAVNSLEFLQVNETGEAVMPDSVVNHQIRPRCMLDSLSSTPMGEFSAFLVPRELAVRRFGLKATGSCYDG